MGLKRCRAAATPGVRDAREAIAREKTKLRQEEENGDEHQRGREVIGGGP